MGDTPPSDCHGLSVVAEIVRHERIQRIQTYDSLDAKAMAVGAAALAFLALAAQGWPPLVLAGTLTVVATLVFSVKAFWLTSVDWIVPADVREAYLTADEHEARLEVLDTEAQLVEQLAAANEQKATLVTRALWALAATATLLVAGLLVQPIREISSWFGG